MKKLFLLIVLFVFVSGYTLFAQTIVITGTVASSVEGEGPIPGVTVTVKGTTIGAITDINGKYSITAPTTATTLQFSYIGMKTTEVEIASRSVIDCVLKSELLALNEVIVTALGIKREKREVTYQTQKVGSEELAAAQPSRAAVGLAGKVAGLQINVQDNSVNPSTQITLRGFRSITASNSALVVIDGAISSSAAFDDLNPNDIADISILKGATAAALYGSRAGNGAILVTTKTGTAGEKFTVGLNSSYTIEKVAYMPKFQSQYGTGWEGAYDNVENTNWGPRFDGTTRQIGPTWPDGSYQAVPYAPVENNLLDFYNTGTSLNNTFYLSGSTDDSKFYLSAGDQRSTGIVPDDTYNRNTFRVNASKKIGNVELSVNSSYFTDESNQVGDNIGDQDRTLYWFLLNTSANIPLSNYKNWDSTDPADLYATSDGYYNAYYQNPYWAIGTNRNEKTTSRLNANFQISWDILDWLNLTARMAANNVWGSGKDMKAAQTYDESLQSAAGAVPSYVEDSEFQQSEYVSDIMLSSSFNFYESFTLKAILGATNITHKFHDKYVSAVNLSIPGFYDVSNGTGSLGGRYDSYDGNTSVWGAVANSEEFINYGFFGDFTLGYKNFAFLNFSGRNDWTSTLAPGNNSYFYPSVGVSFVATDAIEALKNNEILSYAKVTVSNSTVYNDLAAYRLNETFSKSSAFPFGSINGFYLSGTTVDANIKKEKLNTNEVGLNLGFLKSRISLDVSYYVTKTTDLITNTTPSETSGATAFLTNIGELKGHGIEVSLGGRIVKAGDFTWDMNLNYTTNETIVESIKEGLDEIALRTTGQWGIYAVKGESFPQLKANTYERDSQDRIVVDATSGEPKTLATLQNMGNTMPDYIVGLSNSFNYKGFGLSATIDYRTGHVFYSQGADQMEFTGRSLESVSANREDFVIPNSVIETSPGVYEENTNIPIPGGRQSYWTDVYNDVKSNYVRDATAFKVRELVISYNLPANILNTLPVSKVRVGFIARNLYTLLPAENAFSDPEFNNTNNNSVGVGGYLQSPPTRSFGVNLNVEF
jgi:TonB-linked SusC/RagA family outer membrane protein